MSDFVMPEPRPDSGDDRGATRGTTRRALARGAVWTVPAVTLATAAPAFASTIPCEVTTNFDDLQVGSSPTTLTFGTSTTTASLAYASGGQGGDPTPGATGRVAATSTNPSWNYLELQLVQNLNQGDYVTLTITFTQPVENLSFKIHDIDRVTNQWYDEVVVGPTGFTATPSTNVIGSGTSADPFRNSVAGDQPIGSGLESVDLRWTGMVSQVTITYRAGQDGNASSQHVALGNISFTDCQAPAGRMTASSARLQVATGHYRQSASTRALVPGRDN